MAYSDTELQDYWSSVQDGSVLSNAAPNSFQGSDTFTPNQTSDLQDIRDTGFMDRQAAMDFSEGYRTDPEQAEMLSDRLSGVLESDSPYIQRARTKATEAAAGRGLMNSSMAAGAAEGAAIDRGLQVAKGDVDVDKFNVGATNQAQDLQYQAATDIAGRTQDFQSQLGGAEADYIFDKAKSEQEFEEAKALADDKAAADMKKDALRFASDRAMALLESNAGLNKTYLDAYGGIASADISKSDKNAQLKALFNQIKWATANNEAYKKIKIVGSGVPNFSIAGV